MTAMLRVKLRWTGFQGAPGYSIFHFRDFGAPGGWEPGPTEAAACVDRVKTFAQALNGVLPNGLTLTTLGDVEEIEDTNGQLVDIHSVAQPTPMVSNVTAGPYAAPVGAVINWRTGTVRKGRRIRGRTFLVPLIGACFENNGTLIASALTTINAASTTFIADAVAPDLGVYARPSAPGATDGQWAPISSFNVPDMGAVLRSRRD